VDVLGTHGRYSPCLRVDFEFLCLLLNAELLIATNLFVHCICWRRGFQENVKPESLGGKHRDALFKKFVKKWNGNKLPQVARTFHSF